MTKLRVLLMKDGAGGNWVAQCLEYDIAAQGENLQEAMSAFEYVLNCEAAYSSAQDQEPLAGIGPAPDHYWRMYDQCGWPLAPSKGDDFPQQFGNLPGLHELRVA